MSRFLVTGGAGFIGSNLVQRLLREGHRVRVVDNFSTGKWENLKDLACEDETLEIVIEDIGNLDAMKKAASAMDYVVHLAALSSVAKSIEDPEEYNSVNVAGTLNLLISSKEARVKRFIYVSSSAIYGDNPELPKREEMEPEPVSPYAVSKLAGEYYCKTFHSMYSFGTIILRLFNVFGPRQSPDSEYAAVVPRFILSLLTGRPLTIYGDGDQSRDFTYVDNVVEGIVTACKARRLTGEVINVASGNRTSLNTLVKLLSELIDNNTRPVHVPPRPGDVRHSLADVSKAQKLLKYQTRVDLREGLEKTIGWFLKSTQ
jgi:UDP-glucose 4-epimerase